MSPVEVVVADTARDIQAEGIARAVAEREDMTLVAGRVLAVSDADALLESRSLTNRCGIILVGADADTEEPAERYLAQFPNHPVMRMTAPLGNVVRIATRRIGLQEVLGELWTLDDQAGFSPQAHVASLRADLAATGRTARTPEPKRRGGPLLSAAMLWIHETRRNAVAGLTGGTGDLPGLTVTATAVVQLLDTTREQKTATRRSRCKQRTTR